MYIYIYIYLSYISVYVCTHTRIFSGELVVSVVTIKSVSRHGQMAPGEQNQLQMRNTALHRPCVPEGHWSLPGPTDHLVRTSAWQVWARFPV